MMPITMCSQRQPGKTAAMKNSLIMATRKKTPSRAPTVGTEAGVNRSATHDRMSQAMPVSRNIHQGPASRDSPARVLDRVAYLHRPGIATGPVYCGLTGSVPALGRA